MRYVYGRLLMIKCTLCGTACSSIQQDKWYENRSNEIKLKTIKRTRIQDILIPFFFPTFFCKLLRCISKERSFIKTTRKKRSRQEDKRSGHTTVQGAIKDFQSLTMYRATKQVTYLSTLLPLEWMIVRKVLLPDLN